MIAPVIVLSPDEASCACSGNWPAGVWLVVTLLGVKGEVTWEAAYAEGVPDAARGRPVWPPFPGLIALASDPADEIAVLDLLAISPGIADLARAALVPTPADPDDSENDLWNNSQDLECE